MHAGKAVDELVKTLEGDEKIGAQIVGRAVEEPLRMIAHNADEEGAVVINKINESKEANYGFNAGTGAYEDLVALPVSSTDRGDAHCPAERGLHRRPDVHHLNMISDIPEKKEAAGHSHGGPGGGMDGMY